MIQFKAVRMWSHLLAGAILSGCIATGCIANGSGVGERITLATKDCPDEQQARAALKQSPSSLHLHRLGLALACHHKSKEAITVFRQVIQRYPEFAQGFDVYVDLGDALHQQGQIEEAITAYRNAIAHEADPASGVNQKLSNLLKQQNRPQEAAAVLAKASHSKSASTTGSALQLGDEFYRQNKLPEAIAAYRQAITLLLDASYGTELYNKLGIALTKNNQIPEAVAAFKKVHELQRKSEEAFRKIQPPDKLPPDEVSAYGSLGQALVEFKRIPEALNAYRQATALNPALNSESTAYREALAHVYLAEELLVQRQQEAAIAAYQQAIAIAPTYPYAYNGLGQIFLEQNKIKEAILFFEKAVALRPDNKAMQRDLEEARRRQAELK
jgi:tetratricopeptide (TPR) repeat protein